MGKVEIKRGNRLIQLESIFLFHFLLNNAATNTTETCQPIKVVSVALVKYSLASETIVYLGFFELFSDSVDYYYTYREADGSAAKRETCATSDHLLDEIEQCYPMVFSEHTYPMLEHHTPFSIPLINKSVQPKQQCLYPLSESELVELLKLTKVSTDSKQIVLSSSPYGHPIIFTKKKGGVSLRMYVDYRTSNNNTITDAWPFPRINKLLGCLRGAKVFYLLNLRDGYHLIPVEPKDCYKMVLSYCYGSFDFIVIQLTLKIAPSYFLHLMTMLFSNLVDKCVVVYLYDKLFSLITELSVRLIYGKYLIGYEIESFTLNVRNATCALRKLSFLDILYCPLELRLYPERFVQLLNSLNPLVYVKYRHILDWQTITGGLSRIFRQLPNP